LSLESTAREFIAEYGERACLLLRAIYEESREAGDAKLGDFSVKGVKARLKSWGIEYNPVPLLMKLERELGVIETSYRSTTQRWWRVRNTEFIEKALRMCGVRVTRSLEDSRVRLLRIQFMVLNPKGIAENLRRLLSKKALTKADLEFIRRVVFEELPLMVKLKEDAEKLGYEAELREELEAVEELMDIVERLVASEREEHGLEPAYSELEEGKTLGGYLASRSHL